MEQDAIKGGVSQEKDFFERLYHQYKYLMYKTAKYYTSEPAELEDIMQDSVERLLRNTHKLMDIPSCTQAAYLVYTVRSVAINLKRHQSVVAEHTLPVDIYEQDTYESPHLSPAEIVERLELNQQLSALWSQLPDEADPCPAEGHKAGGRGGRSSWQSLIICRSSTRTRTLPCSCRKRWSRMGCAWSS